MTALRGKWRKHPDPPKSPRVGQIVIVHEGELPRAHWKVAKIEELVSERTAVIKTIPGMHVTRRAIQQLYPLEIEDEALLQDIPKRTNPDVSKAIEVSKVMEPELPGIARPKRLRKQKRDKDFVYDDEMEQIFGESEPNLGLGSLAEVKQARKLKRLNIFKIGTMLSIILMIIILLTIPSSANPLVRMNTSTTLIEPLVITVMNTLPSTTLMNTSFLEKIQPRRKPIRRRYRIKPKTYVTQDKTSVRLHFQ